MSTYTTQAICLKAIDYSETDRIVTFYSPDCGRIDAMVRGARKSNSKLSGACELLGFSELHLAKGKNLDVLCQYQPLEPFSRLRTDILKLSFATLFAEQVRYIASEFDGNSANIFTMLIEALRRLESASECEVLSLAVGLQLNLLNEAGYCPDFQTCIQCDDALSYEMPYYGFSMELGGLICGECRDAFPHAAMVNVSTSTIRVLAAPEQADLWPQASPFKIQKFLQYYFLHKLERRLQSGAFLLTLLA